MLKILINTILITSLISLSLNIQAHNKVVVVPLSDDAAPLKNVIRVSEKNGDFTTITAAINSITDSASDNPYLVILGPGEFQVVTNTLILPQYVNLVGSGTEQTSINSQVSHATSFEDAAGLLVSNGASVSNLTLLNIGLNNAGHRVVGIAFIGFSSASNIKVIASSSGTKNYGVYASGNEITLTDSEAIASDGTHSYGAWAGFGTFNIRDTSLIASVATTGSFGTVDTNTGYFDIRNSVIISNGTGVEINNAGTKIIQSEANGITFDVVDLQGGTTNCLDVYNSSVSFISC